MYTIEPGSHYFRVGRVVGGNHILPGGGGGRGLVAFRGSLLSGGGLVAFRGWPLSGLLAAITL